MWLGILADWVFGLPAIFVPQKVLSLLGFRLTQDPVWTAFAALLVVLLSLFYIPGASNPSRYHFSTWLAVFARPLEVIFFSLLTLGYYPTFALFNGFLFLIQFPLLLIIKHQPSEEYELPQALQARAEDRSAVWLKQTLWLGILANWILGVPAIFAPERLLNLVGARPTQDPVWTAFAALILVLLGLFYIPGANQPYRYRANVWMAVFARLPSVIFFFLLWPRVYPTFGLLDGLLFLLQFPFLVTTSELIPERRLKDTEIFEYKGTTFRPTENALRSSVGDA